MKKLVCGVGVNDSSYSVGSGKYQCKFYTKWAHMLQRCYDQKYKDNKKSYEGCTVCDEWLTFSNFKSWMEKQDWQGNQLDKDLIVKGNKIYSPETCVFVDPLTNRFTNYSQNISDSFLIGTCWNAEKSRYQAECSNPFTKRSEFLGYFSCQSEAHKAWKRRKHEIACQLADLQTDSRVADALRSRYK